MIDLVIFHRNAFNSFLKNYVSSFEEEEFYSKYRDDYVKRSVFSNWFLQMPSLKEEKEDLDEAYDIIIEKFRFVNLESVV